jgi:hypothetical protein
MKEINFKEFSKSWAYKRLKHVVVKDCLKGDNCFNITGCNKKERVGMNCAHRPCDKFKYIIDRLKHYYIKDNIDPELLLTRLEQDRSYWYQNYYQHYNIAKVVKELKEKSVSQIHEEKK